MKDLSEKGRLEPFDPHGRRRLFLLPGSRQVRRIIPPGLGLGEVEARIEPVRKPPRKVPVGPRGRDFWQRVGHPDDRRDAARLGPAGGGACQTLCPVSDGDYHHRREIHQLRGLRWANREGEAGVCRSDAGGILAVRARYMERGDEDSSPSSALQRGGSTAGSWRQGWEGERT